MSDPSTQLRVGLADVTHPALIDGETREVSMGLRIVVALGEESVVLTADVAEAVALRLNELAVESRKAVPS